ncbi:hypothetical protein IMM1_36570 [Pseudocoprococcus immobilis]
MDTEVPKDASGQNTIFDDVFRTIAEKMPILFIAAVNYIFGTDYPYTEEIVQLRNEHLSLYGRDRTAQERASCF